MSRRFLLDTNVPSELTRPQPDPSVARWLEGTDDDLMHSASSPLARSGKALPSIQKRTAALDCVSGGLSGAKAPASPPEAP